MGAPSAVRAMVFGGRAASPSDRLTVMGLRRQAHQWKGVDCPCVDEASRLIPARPRVTGAFS